RHRPGADGPQRPRRRPLRHPLPRLLPGRLRGPRRQRAGPAPRPGGLRLVRHPDLDRRGPPARPRGSPPPHRPAVARPPSGHHSPLRQGNRGPPGGTPAQRSDWWVLILAMLALALAALATNLAANVVSPANDFANLWPRRIGFRTGALITGLVGIAIQPWRL